MGKEFCAEFQNAEISDITSYPHIDRYKDIHDMEQG